MVWNLSTDRAVYIQIVEEIQLRIISGYYKLGDKLPSVRDLAQEASVNPNTMQKALSELEQRGLVYSQRTSGRFITEDSVLVENTRLGLATGEVETFIERMSSLGYSQGEICEIVNNKVKGVE